MPHGSLPFDAELFAEIGRVLGATPGDTDLDRVTRVAAARVPGAEHAGVLCRRGAQFVAAAATDESVEALDRLLLEVGSGPGLEAATGSVGDAAVQVDDLRSDDRWPVFARRAVEVTGVRSLASFHVSVGRAGEQDAALTVYAREPSAFDERSRPVGRVLATYAGLALATTAAREQVVELERALDVSREVGVAIGILMGRHRATREQAFDLLRHASSRTERPITQLAEDVVSTGDLPA